MNDITKFSNSCIAMTTKEIADLTVKRHDNIIRDAEQMFNELEISHLIFEATYLDTQGKPRKCYILDKKLSLCLVAKYDTKTRMAIIDRWEELENKKPISITDLSRLEILEMAIKAEKELIALKEINGVLETNLEGAESKIETLKPMAEYGHNVFISENLYTPTNVGQMIGLSAMILNRHLKRLHVIRTGTGQYTDYELCMRYTNLGLVKYKETPGLSSTTGLAITHRALRWTRRGYDWLIENRYLITDGNKKSLPLPKQEVIKRGA